MALKAILFDFDGTLVDTLPISYDAFKFIFKKYDERELSTEEIVSMFGPTEDEIISKNLENKEYIPQAIEDYYRIYERGHEPDKQLTKKMVDLLFYIRSKGIKVGVVTGKSQKAFHVSSKALGLTHFFDYVITGDDVTKAKPDPEGIYKSLSYLGVSKEETLFIGDSNADIAAGKSAGLRTFGVKWLSTYQSTIFETEPELTFTNIDQFWNWLSMECTLENKWLDWAKEIQAISQIGLTYAKDVYDLERYESLRQLSVDILANYSFVDRNKIKLSFANEEGYATPKVDVRGVVFVNEKILLVREKIDGAWALPGGWADVGLSPSEVAVKEIKEESGYDVVPIKLLAVLDKKFHFHPPEPYHVYKMFILCEMISGEAASGVETSEVKFFSEDNLPPLSLERNTEQQIRTMFEFLREPNKNVLLD